MNQWNLGWRASARLRYGMHWRQAAPTLHDYRLPVSLLITLTACLWLILSTVGWINNYTARKEIEVEARVATKLLIDCMNGNAFWKGADGSEVGCMKAEWNRGL